jgi:hypothetical protein
LNRALLPFAAISRMIAAYIECAVLDRLFDAWLDEAVLVEGLLPQSMAHGWGRSRWRIHARVLPLHAVVI